MTRAHMLESLSSSWLHSLYWLNFNQWCKLNFLGNLGLDLTRHNHAWLIFFKNVFGFNGWLGTCLCLLSSWKFNFWLEKLRVSIDRQSSRNVITCLWSLDWACSWLDMSSWSLSDYDLSNSPKVRNSISFEFPKNSSTSILELASI